MVDVAWIGQDGDWNDPTNWSSGQIPTSADTASFTNSTSATIEGAAFVGDLVLQNSDLVVSGDFQSDGTSLAEVNDQVDSTGTLSIEAWGTLSLDELNLKSTFLEEQGVLVTGASTIASGLIIGGSATWLSSQTTITGTLGIVAGANVFGNVCLQNDAAINLDYSSGLAAGTITAAANSTISFSSLSGGLAPDAVIGDAIYVAAGATLTLGSGDSSPIIIVGSVSGPGSIYLSNSTLTFGSASTLSSTPILAGSEIGAPASNYVIDDSTLDLRGDDTASNARTSVAAQGASDTIYGGNTTLVVNILTSDASNIDLGSGVATVYGSLGALSVSGGTGDLTVYDAHSSDTLSGGSSNNTLVGGAGSLITAGGAGLNTIGTTGSSGRLDASGTTGNTNLFSGSGTGTTTMIGGSGSDVFACQSEAIDVQCGSGSDSIWAGEALSTTIQGGLGSAVIQSGKNAEVTLSGNGSDTIISGLGTTSVTDSGTSGSLTLFSIGSSTVNLSGDTESLRVVVGSACVSIEGTQSGSEFWCLDNANLSLTGPTSAMVVLAGSDDTVSAASATGTSTFFLSNSNNSTLMLEGGATEVIGGSQSSTLRIAGGDDSIYAGSGSLELDFTADTSLSGSVVVVNYNPDLDTIDFGPNPVSAVQTTWGLSLSFGHTHLLLYQFVGQVPDPHQ